MSKNSTDAQDALFQNWDEVQDIVNDIVGINNDDGPSDELHKLMRTGPICYTAQQIINRVTAHSTDVLMQGDLSMLSMKQVEDALLIFMENSYRLALAVGYQLGKQATIKVTRGD